MGASNHRRRAIHAGWSRVAGVLPQRGSDVRFGRGPQEARTFFLNDVILVRLRGILTPAEMKLAESREGQELVKETRRQLHESSRPLLESVVRDVVGCGVISLHTDMSTKTGERIIVFTVDTDLDELFG